MPLTTEQATPMHTGPGWELWAGDCRTVLGELPAASVHCCVTSPPYWGLRDYKHDAQIGLEETPEAFVDALVDVFRGVRRVLRDDGTLWLNLGDSYASGGRGGGGMYMDERGEKAWGPRAGMNGWRSAPPGLKHKDLVGIPWRVAFALQADGWYLRSDIIWAKPNPMPESVTDRPTKAHEHVFLLTKSPRYYYDADAIREPSVMRPQRRPNGRPPSHVVGPQPKQTHSTARRTEPGPDAHPRGRNKRTVWTVPTQAYPGAHFAVFPEALVKPCILAGTSERGVCGACGAPWGRVVVRGKPVDGDRERNVGGRTDGLARIPGGEAAWAERKPPQTTGWQPSCDCGADPVPATVLDPFAGTATTGAVACEYGRSFVGIEASDEYVEIARERMRLAAMQTRLI